MFLKTTLGYRPISEADKSEADLVYRKHKDKAPDQFPLPVMKCQHNGSHLREGRSNVWTFLDTEKRLLEKECRTGAREDCPGHEGRTGDPGWVSGYNREMQTSGMVWHS